jgi:hypothetical protein
MSTADSALSITIDGTPDLPGEVLGALYRITGRSRDELRRSILAGEPVYSADLFGPDHHEVAPRLEKACDYLAGLGLGMIAHERVDGQTDEITLDTMREILAAAENGN